MPKQEQFNPHNEEYKKVADLPKDQQQSFTNTEEGGFVKNDVIRFEKEMERLAQEYNQDRNFVKRLFGLGEKSLSDIVEERAGTDNELFGVKRMLANPEQLTDDQREKFKRARACLWSQKGGDPVDAVMHLLNTGSNINYLVEHLRGTHNKDLKVAKEIIKKAGADFIDEMKKWNYRGDAAATAAEEFYTGMYQYYTEEEAQEILGESSRNYFKNVLPRMVLALKRAGYFS